MSFRAEEFRAWMIATGHPANSAASYRSYLNAVDQVIGGIDEMAAERGWGGAERLMEEAIARGVLSYPSNRRSGFQKYAQYRERAGPDVEAAASDLMGEADRPVTAVFRLERDMQAQMRRQLAFLEDGLVAIDEGREQAVATGRIDILARDSAGRRVVIELKAGACPPGALEQALGYADDLSSQDDGPVRVMLVAESFSDRMRAAARRTPGVQLFAYSYAFSFTAVA